MAMFRLHDDAPMIVHVATTSMQLDAVCKLRSTAYGKHLPELGEKLQHLEHEDINGSSVILLVEHKYTKQPIATVRMQSNHTSCLMLEQSVQLPNLYSGKQLMEPTRLVVQTDKLSYALAAKLNLFRALYQHCIQTNIDYIVAAARPPIDKMYFGLLFDEIFPDMFPMKHAANMLHRVLALDVKRAPDIWKEANHRWYNFMISKC